MDSTRRFSDRVADYVKYRPSYPAAFLMTLREITGLTTDSVVADVGSGTGILTENFLHTGWRVFGVEPNDEMRGAGEAHLRAYPRFTSIKGTAEQTTLPEGAVDLVAAGQAFHWFDRAKAKGEFRRVLRPGGWIMLIWNERRVGVPFLDGYEALLRTFATDYDVVDHRRISREIVAEFFSPNECTLHTFENKQTFDFAGLQGRLLSSSYAPRAGDARHEPMLAALRNLFDAHQKEGQVGFDYDTEMYVGRGRAP